MNGTSPSLPAEEWGLVVGLARLGAEKVVLDRVLASEEARDAWRQLREGDRDQRATAIADLLSEVLAPLSPAMERLDPSWLLEALAGEPAALAAALAEGTSFEARVAAGEERWTLDPQTRMELCRVVFAPLEPLTAAPAGPLGQELGALGSVPLLFELARGGARTIGTSLAGAPLELRARAMANAGAPWSSELAAAAARPTDPPTRERARAQVARAAALPAPTPLHRLRTVGVLAIAPVLAGEGRGSVHHVAGRLPVELGRLLIA